MLKVRKNTEKKAIVKSSGVWMSFVMPNGRMFVYDSNDKKAAEYVRRCKRKDYITRKRRAEADMDKNSLNKLIQLRIRSNKYRVAGMSFGKVYTGRKNESYRKMVEDSMKELWTVKHVGIESNKVEFSPFEWTISSSAFRNVDGQTDGIQFGNAFVRFSPQYIIWHSEKDRIVNYLWDKLGLIGIYSNSTGKVTMKRNFIEVIKKRARSLVRHRLITGTDIYYQLMQNPYNELWDDIIQSGYVACLEYITLLVKTGKFKTGNVGYSEIYMTTNMSIHVRRAMARFIDQQIVRYNKWMESADSMYSVWTSADGIENFGEYMDSIDSVRLSRHMDDNAVFYENKQVYDAINSIANERDRLIMNLVVRRIPYKVVAEYVGVSEKTVKRVRNRSIKHFKHLFGMDKLDEASIK